MSCTILVHQKKMAESLLLQLMGQLYHPQPVTWGWQAGQTCHMPEAHLPLAVVPELQCAER